MPSEKQEKRRSEHIYEIDILLVFFFACFELLCIFLDSFTVDSMLWSSSRTPFLQRACYGGALFRACMGCNVKMVVRFSSCLIGLFIHLNLFYFITKLVW